MTHRAGCRIPPGFPALRGGVRATAPLTAFTPRNDSRAAMTELARLLGVPVSSPMITWPLRHHVRWVSLNCVAVPQTSRPLATPEASCPTNKCYVNWSGWQGNLSSPNNASADWKVPSAGYPVNQYSTFSSTWPGIGQGKSKTRDELIQDGTEQDAYCSAVRDGGCRATATRYYFWFEMYPDEAAEEVTNFYPKPGDHVAAVAAYLHSEKTADFEICDARLKVCGTAVQASPGPPAATAEWIMERPTLVNGNLHVLPYLAKYGSVLLYSASACNASCYRITALGGRLQITMETCNEKTVMSTAGALAAKTGNSFTWTWKAYGDNGCIISGSARHD